MSFRNWNPVFSNLICQYLGFAGVYATLDAALYTIPSDVNLTPYEIECPDDARNITECWSMEYAEATSADAVGIICCEGRKC